MKQDIHLIVRNPSKPETGWPPSACGKCWMDFKASNRTTERNKATCHECRNEIDPGGTDEELHKRVLHKVIEDNKQARIAAGWNA